MTTTTARRELTCQRCGYSWLSRLEHPKECPECKSRYWSGARSQKHQG